LDEEVPTLVKGRKKVKVKKSFLYELLTTRSDYFRQINQCGRWANFRFTRNTSREEVKKAITRTQNGISMGPNHIPIETRKVLGEGGITRFTNLHKIILGANQIMNDRKAH